MQSNIPFLSSSSSLSLSLSTSSAACKAEVMRMGDRIQASAYEGI
ncbi:unnamed protein product [Rhodiola kirilowii]